MILTMKILKIASVKVKKVKGKKYRYFYFIIHQKVTFFQMLISFFFFILSFSKYQNVSDATFGDFIIASIVKPFFVGFYDGNGSTSQIFLDTFKSLGDASNKDFSVTTINCSNYNELCVNLSINKLPSILLFRTQNPLFRKEYLGSLDLQEMIDFVHNKTSSSNKKLKKFDLRYFEIEQEHSFPVVSQSLELYLSTGLDIISKTLDLTLYYSESQRNNLRIYVSPFCYRSYKGKKKFSPMSDFIYENRFSSTHLFTSHEIVHYNPKIPLILLANRGNINEIQKDFLVNLSYTLCDGYNLGWTDISNDKKAEHILHLTDYGQSTLIFLDRERKEVYKMMKPMTLLNAKHFVLNITTNSPLNDRETDPKWPIAFSFAIVVSIVIFKAKFGKHYDKLLHYLERSKALWIFYQNIKYFFKSIDRKWTQFSRKTNLYNILGLNYL